MTKLDELKHGDILLFGTDGCWLDTVICKVLNSKVCHAALYYSDHVLADAASGGINTHWVDEVAGNPPGREVFVRRLQAGQSLQPVLDAAKSYLREDNRYDWAGLVLLGLILVYRKVTAPSAAQKAMTLIFRRIAFRLDHWIDENLPKWTHGLYKSGPHPMFCSEFVFRCFQDAPAPYHLEIHNGDVLRGSRDSAGDDTLLARMLAAVPPASSGGADRSGSADSGASDEQLAEQLMASLAGTNVLAAERGFVPGAELVQAAEAMGRAIQRYVTQGKATSGVSGLQFLNERKAFFVTPNDLLNNCVNVSDEGALYLSRQHDKWDISRQSEGK